MPPEPESSRDPEPPSGERQTIAFRTIRDTFAAGMTLGAVMLLYGTPLVLGLLIGLFRDPGTNALGSTDVQGAREAVVWVPPSPPGQDDGSADGEEGGEADGSEAEPLDPDATAPDGVDADEALVLPADATTKGPRLRVRAKRVVRGRRAPRELTRKQQRRIEKRERQKERQAERKQCAELADQIVQVDVDEWWVGRELANCYRTHLEQFDAMGSAWWASDEDGEHVGVGLNVRRGAPGAPARAAGFASGDIIHSVNGIKVRQWGGVSMAATQVLRSRVKLKMTRNGEPRTVVMRVVGEDALEEKRRDLEAVAVGD